MEEKKFPIYKFTARWNQDDYQNNSTSLNAMYKENPTEEKLNSDLKEFKNHIIQKQIKNNQPVTEWLELKYKYIEDEIWMLNWFSHMTYNQFEKDEDVERSFWQFIDRKMISNRQNGHGEIEKYDDGDKDTFYCFMGAEDRWRWKICRCEDCVRLGKITIDH